MTVAQRWDIVVRLVDGPLADGADHTWRGPVVRVGADPGPGGLRLAGYRGVDARHATLTVYDDGATSVAPVGANPVRVAPHAHVDWKTLDPIAGPVRLSGGSAVHLGPVGRGATLVFVAARPFGSWEGAALVSEVPVEKSAVRVGRVEAFRVSAALIGCLALLVAGVSLTGVVVVGREWLRRSVVALGPVEDGYEFYRDADPTTARMSAAVREGLDAPFGDFVMAPSAEAAGAARPGLIEPRNWDRRLVSFVAASVERHVSAWNVFRRLEAVRNEYAAVVLALRDADLPEVFAAIPYQETRYNPAMVSVACAAGIWQFMPETALRVERAGYPFSVRDCRFQGAGDARWSPSEVATRPDVMRTAPYIEGGRCRIRGCDVDDRADVDRSTAAALFTLAEAFSDPEIRRSGAAVGLTIASHNGGFDDGRHGAAYAKSTNVLPALRRFVAARGDEAAPRVLGDTLLCPHHDDPGTCGGVLMAQTQHYVYAVIAQHLVAVCYYAQNHGTERAFAPWKGYVSRGRYCEDFAIPSVPEVLAGRRP